MTDAAKYGGYHIQELEGENPHKFPNSLYIKKRGRGKGTGRELWREGSGVKVY